jgi:hypothetical protein
MQAHPIYIGCACIYLTSLLLVGGGNRYGWHIWTVARISSAAVFYLWAGATSENFDHKDKTGPKQSRALHPHFYD